MSETIRPRTVLAFDFGLSSIGAAAGQEVTGQAGELPPLPARNGVPDWTAAEALIREWQPALLVVGLPINMDGTESRMAQRARRFARSLEQRFRLPCEMMDERLSTKEAEQQLAGNRKRSIDSAAARLVLESWFAEERARAGDRQ